MNRHINRRKFLQQSAIATAGVWIGASSGFAQSKSPNDKLNIGVIGVANRAGANINGVQHQNIVAICDIDEKLLSGAAAKFPQAKTYHDFRKLLERKDLDAIVISTADHTHAVATIAALETGRHVYCEKPLTHTVAEARRVAQVAAKHKKLATQMGTQIHALDNYRRCVELIQSGSIGRVAECHVWVGGNRVGGNPDAAKVPVPPHVNWDLWVGPAPMRDYHDDYHPRNWRAWWNFGGGTLGDMGCHFIDLVHWSLGLRAPRTVEAEGPPVHPDIAPDWMIVRYEYPPRLAMPPVKMTWYQGGKRPALIEDGTIPDQRSGILFVGETGILFADYHNRQLYPEAKFKDFVAPKPFIPTSIGHHNEWIQACKDGSPTTCNFDYSGALTESVLLGNVAYRVGKKIEWNARALKVTNAPEAEQFIQRAYRKGWEV